MGIYIAEIGQKWKIHLDASLFQKRFEVYFAKKKKKLLKIVWFLSQVYLMATTKRYNINEWTSNWTWKCEK